MSTHRYTKLDKRLKAANYSIRLSTFENYGDIKINALALLGDDEIGFVHSTFHRLAGPSIFIDESYLEKISQTLWF